MTFLYNDAYLHVLGPAKHPRRAGPARIRSMGRNLGRLRAAGG